MTFLLSYWTHGETGRLWHGSLVCPRSVVWGGPGGLKSYDMAAYPTPARYRPRIPGYYPPEQSRSTVRQAVTCAGRPVGTTGGWMRGSGQKDLSMKL